MRMSIISPFQGVLEGLKNVFFEVFLKKTKSKILHGEDEDIDGIWWKIL